MTRTAPKRRMMEISTTKYHLNWRLAGLWFVCICKNRVKLKMLRLSCFPCRKLPLRRMTMKKIHLRRRPKRQRSPSKSQTKWLKSGELLWGKSPLLASSERSHRPLRLPLPRRRGKEGFSVATRWLTVQVGSHLANAACAYNNRGILSPHIKSCWFLFTAFLFCIICCGFLYYHIRKLWKVTF